jgi:hypothetical protein
VVRTQHSLANGQGTFEEGPVGGQLGLVPEQEGQVVRLVAVSGWSEPSARTRMAKARSNKGLSAANSPLIQEQAGQAVDAAGSVWGGLRPALARRWPGALEQGPGGGQVTLSPEHGGQIVEACGGVGVIGAQHAHVDIKDALLQRLGGRQLALGLE